MTILYAIVAKPGEPSKILAEFSKTTGNFKQVTATILGKITDAERKASLVSALALLGIAPALSSPHPPVPPPSPPPGHSPACDVVCVDVQ
jgi:hypothetical protein